MSRALFNIISDGATKYEVLSAIYAKAEDPPVFYSPEMLKIWEAVYERQFELATLYIDQIPTICLPIIPGKFAQNVSYPGWDNLGIVATKDIQEDQDELFWTALVESKKRIILSELSEDQIDFKLLKDVVSISVPMRKCPYISLIGGWENLHENLSKKLVRNIRQYGNKAKSAGISFQVNFAKAYTKDYLLAGLSDAFSWHDTRMSAIGLVSKFTPAQFEAYHKQVLSKATNLFVVEAFNEEKQRIAWYYGFLNTKRLAWFNGGYNPDYQKYSPGTLIIASLIDFALENGIVIFDFLRGNEDYKQKWASGHNQNQTVYLAQANLSNAWKLNAKFFNDTRRRIGGKKAMKELYSQLFN